MPLLFLIELSGEAIIRALNWTLIHSLWQGMLLSLAAGGIIYLTKRSSPSLRYNLLTVALLFFLIAVAATFNMQLLKANAIADTIQLFSAVPSMAIEPAMQLPAVISELSVTDSAVNFFNANASWIVFTWLVIIGLQFIRLTTGLIGVHQLKKRQVFSAGEYWNNRIGELSRQLQINKNIKLLQSGIAKMPAVIGYFKPVILFPAGMLATLPANEVEAILLHELAHIHRKDFLINVLQHIVEIVFFFNPAALWVSALIKAERENCCDEIAVSQTNSRQNYINALLSFQEFNLAFKYPVATAFTGEKNHLMNRIKRIIYNHNKTLNNMEKKFLAAGLIITSLCIFAFTSNKAQQKETPKEIASPQTSATKKNITAITDTVPASTLDKQNNFNGKTTTTVKGKRYTMVTENNQVTELYINGEKVPTEKITDYKNITIKILEEQKKDMESAEKDMAQAAIEQAQAKVEMEQAAVELAQAKIEMEESQKEMAIDNEQAKKDMEQHTIEMEQSKVEIAQAKIEIEQAQKEMEINVVQAKKDIEQAKKQLVQSQKEIQQSKIALQQAKLDIEQSKKDIEQSKILQEKIISDFIKEQLIKSTSELSSFKLSDEELIVNGVKQPEAMYKKFKAKYVKSSRWTMMYNNSEEVK